MDLEEFANPGKSYRPSPFWSWNDKLDAEELRWQVREFAEKGFGGYFMHSRVGLATPYLSPEWMNCIRVSLEEGRKVDLESWLYDEDRWPSGFAGGFVPARSDEYRGRYIDVKEIRAEELAEALLEPSLLGVFEIQFLSPTEIRRFAPIHRPEDAKGDGRLFLFKVEIDRRRSNWYNGESYVDLLNPKVTEEFLELTLDAYAEEFRQDFSEFMPGIFTDEPNYVGRDFIPWTGEMAEYFRRINGYSIIDKLPLLHFEGEGALKVRYDFWKTVTQRFIESFSEPYGKRCNAYGLMMTGHYLYEDNLDIQIRNIGAAMPHYEYMHAPGVDHLGRNINNPLTLKQCSSVAHQFNQSRVVSELFGCSGHSMTFEDQKWIADFHLALGITFLCPHLSLYAMKGDGKRDYPPTFSYHQPYWEHIKLLNDYFARACYVCQQGQFRADILVLHSIGSAWATFTPIAQNKETLPWKYNNELVKLQDDLLALHRDFDYGDEIVLSRHGRIEGEDFVVKDARYKVLVVPPSLTWSQETVRLLEGFLNAGGKVIFVGENPSLIDGEPAEKRWRKTLAHPNAVQISADRELLDKTLDRVLPRSISVVDKTGREIEDILVQQRVDGDYCMCFLANTSRTRTHNAVIRIPETGEASEWNLFDGSVSKATAVTKEGKTFVSAVFHPVGSHFFVIHTSMPAALTGPLSQPCFEKKSTKLLKEWGFKRLHPNSLTLDTCRYSFGNGKWSEETPVWKVRREAWKEAGLEKYIGIQPWVLLTKDVKPSKEFELRIRARFRSEVKGKRVFLVVESAPKWKLNVNGKIVPTKSDEWHWDKHFGKIDISDQVKVGENQIELSCRYSLNVPVEDVYIVGDFGVKKISETEYALADEPRTLVDGDWGRQGYPFYAGTMRYESSFNLQSEVDEGEHVLLCLPEARGTLFLVSVNGEGPIAVCWHPLEADVTELVHKGKNKLTLDVVSSLRNTFGPLHHKGGDLYSVGPNSFVDEENWVDAYQFVPYGLIKGAEIVIRKVKKGR